MYIFKTKSSMCKMPYFHGECVKCDAEYYLGINVEVWKFLASIVVGVLLGLAIYANI